MDKKIKIVGICGLALILILLGLVIFLLAERSVSYGEQSGARSDTLAGSGGRDPADGLYSEEPPGEVQPDDVQPDESPQLSEELLLQREAETARRRAEQEEFARASRELQEAMRAVNDLISQGKALLERGDFAGAQKVFDEARLRMPPGERRFEAQKLADMAEAWYDVFSRNPSSPEGADAAARAIALALESIDFDNANALPHFIQGKISRDRNEWENAIIAFSEASRLDPGNSMYQYNLGRSYFSARRIADARGAFENTVRLNPQFEAGWYNLGGTLRLLNRNDEALNAYRRAIAVKDDYFLAHREIGRILLAKKDYNGAINAFANALKHNPGDLAPQYELGILRELGAAQSEAGNYAAAEESFARALQQAPADAQTNYNMAVVKMALNKNAEAASFARHAAESSPSSAVYAYTLGLALESVNDAAGAIAAYQRAILLDAQYLRPRINLGNLYLARDNFDEGINCLSEAFRIESANFEVNNNLGAVYAKMERWSSSIEHYERALAREPNHPIVHLNLARAYTGAGDLTKAQNSYQAVLRLNRDSWDALFELGKTCVSLGMRDDARKYLVDLLQRNPSYSGRAEAERILGGL